MNRFLSILKVLTLVTLLFTPNEKDETPLRALSKCVRTDGTDAESRRIMAAIEQMLLDHGAKG